MRNDLASRSRLYVYSDGPLVDAPSRDLQEIIQVRELIRERRWCGEVVVKESDTNRGLADSILSGVSEVFEQHDRAIVLEDDIVVSPGFLEYMNSALHLYKDAERVWHVSSYLPAISLKGICRESLFLSFMSCWGWATWADRWSQLQRDPTTLLEQIKGSGRLEEFDLGSHRLFSGQLSANISGEISTWAILWYATIFRQNGLCLYPKGSLVKNIGRDGSGTNCKETSGMRIDADLVNSISLLPIPIQISLKAMRRLKRFYRYGPEATIGSILRIQLGNWKHTLAKAIQSRVAGNCSSG